ncbi:MAG: hypothetical protein PHC51_04645, partial [bacterium]|nr:hypothetical protein [bacterium]
AHLAHGDYEGVCADQEDIIICHIPVDNQENAHTIKINADELSAHEAHGDTVGGCPTLDLQFKEMEVTQYYKQ